MPESVIAPAVEQIKPTTKGWRCRTHEGETEVAPDQPHAIVMCLSRQHSLPHEHGVRFYFRHATPEFAAAQAQRLAAKEPGRRFAVYIAGPSFKVEKPAAAP
jgi:hypothetical protein